MADAPSVRIGPLKKSELEEADRIVRLAFGTFLGMPDPMTFLGDRQMLTSRWRSDGVTMLAARADGRLIGSNALTTWGSFGFFGPLTVLPEYWGRGVALHLMQATVDEFDRRGVRRTGLFTFAHSPKHVGLYRRFGYWPGYLTALMKLEPVPQNGTPAKEPVLLSKLSREAREQAIEACRRLSHRIDKGLDLTEEIRSVIRQRIGDVVLLYSRKTLDGFAVCHHGPGSEAGSRLCYVKFAAATPGDGAGERFTHLLEAVEQFAATRGVPVEAGVSFAREDAYRILLERGYRAAVQGVAMQRPHAPGHNRADAFVLDDWR